MNIHWLPAIIGIGLAGAILFLVRRDHLHGPYALWWLLVAASALILGTFPGTVDWLGRITGIYYPPILPIVIGLALVLIRLLKIDIDRSRQERRMRRLVQRMAMLEEQVARHPDARAQQLPEQATHPMPAERNPSG